MRPFVNWGPRAGGGGLVAGPQGVILQNPVIAAVPSQPLPNGATVEIAGVSWSSFNPTLVGGAFAIVEGQGLVYQASPSQALAFTSTTQTCPFLGVRLGEIPQWEGGFNLFVDVRVPSFLAEGSGEGCWAGVFRPAGTPYATSVAALNGGGFRRNIGIPKTVFHKSQTSAGTADYAGDLPDDDCFSVRIAPGGTLSIGTGEYDEENDAWPVFAHDNIGTAVFTGTNNILSHDSVLFIGVPEQDSDATPTTAWAVDRVRVRIGG